MKFSKLALLAAIFAAAPIAANAQDVGATVYGNDGEAIGTVESNDGTNAVIVVGEYKATLPVSIFGEGENGPTLNATRAAVEQQLAAADAEAKQAAAAAQAEAKAEAEAALAAALVVGAPVVTADAQSLGLIDAINGANIVVKTADAQLVTLPATLMAVDGEGVLVARANLADIMAALEAAGG